MQDSVKYLIHADITASGVVERSDVVGAVFGQTEGLLGDDLDLRDLQESSKIGRIDVQISSESGQSYGEITIGSRLDRVETAILAAALETIERVGPCRANVSVTELEDVRSAKRREVVDRATELLAAFEADSMDSQDIVEAVRERVRVEDITDYGGYPAGPRVADSDAIVVVEGRADVLTLLRYGIKNAVAVEGTDVPDAIADLTQGRTVTAFLDGDRGGDLILKELAQVGAVDYVAIAPDDQSVEDLSRGQVMKALRQKVPYEVVADADSPAEVTATDGSARPAPPETIDAEDGRAGDRDGDRDKDASSEVTDDTARSSDAAESTAATTTDEDGVTDEASPDDADRDADSQSVETLAAHVAAVVGEDSGLVRLLDADFETLVDADADAAFETLVDADPIPETVILDGELDQRVLDAAAQRGVGQIVAESEGEFVKKPTGVRIRTADEFSLRGDVGAERA
ncbi:MAG: DNA primase DnaG [Haloarculaceae archaeon]